jgi:hypothetical protein
MDRTNTPSTIRLSKRRPSVTCSPATRSAKARYAEELAEVESALSRAAFLLRRVVAKAA